MKNSLRELRLILIVFSLVVLLSNINAQDRDKKTDDKSSRKEKAENRLEYNKTGNVYFETTAQKLADNLKAKLDLTKDQAEDIKSTLIDYNKKIHEEQIDSKDEDKDEHLSDNSKLTGGAETRPELMKKFEKIDEDANKDIEKTLNEDQRVKYTKIKESWWKNVKRDVFSSRNEMNYEKHNINSKMTGSVDKNTIDKRENDTTGLEEKFQKNAKALSVSLMKKVDISLEQAAKIQDILVDYQKDVYDTRGKNLSDEDNNQYNGTNRVVGTKNHENKDNDKGQLTGENNKYISDLSKQDKKANDDIENVLNKEQMKKYLNVKNSWWKEIKDKVYSKDVMESRMMNEKTNK